MTKVDPGAFGKARPKIEPDDLEDDVAVLTIAAYDQVEVDDPESPTGKRLTGCLTFQESGDKVIWLNKTQADALVERLGDDSDKWIGKQVPVEKTVTKFRGKDFPKVVIVGDPSKWDGYLNGGSARASRAPAKKAGSKIKGRR